MMTTDFRDVIIQWLEDTTNEEFFSATVVVGDGNTEYDETFDYDDRVFFYFHDEAEFEAYKTPQEGVDFMVVSEQ